MSSRSKKITIISIYYTLAVISVTLLVIYSGPVHQKISSFILFYLMSLIFAVLAGLYLFHTNSVDYHHAFGKISAPHRRDITKRKVLFLSFIYSVIFMLMFIYDNVSFFVFAYWPIMVFLSLLLLLDRRLIFNIQGKRTVSIVQKYGMRGLVGLAALSSMFYLNEFVTMKPVPLRSDLVKGWESVSISIWCLPLVLVSSLIVADWITTAINHEEDKNFFKRADVILFFGIQLLIILFLIVV